MWFKLLCFYNTKTEEYDRGLTDLRSPYDPTEAYIIGDDRSSSTWYATKLWNDIIHTVSTAIRIPESKAENYLIEARKWGQSLSAQGWINTYNHLCENGEMNIVKDILGYE